MELFKASRQWATRPADETFASIGAMHEAVTTYRDDAAVASVPYGALEARAVGDDVVLANRGNGHHGTLTHWAFGQLCGRAEAPASYLRGIPAPLAVACLNHGLAGRDAAEPVQLLIHRNAGRVIRALTSEHYTRIWNADVTARLLELESRGPWQPAPVAIGGSRGLYASDHDMFAFLVDSGRRILEEDQGGLSRGFFVWNSEVGAATFGITTFLYRYVCGNHIVWGAQQVAEVRLRHVGSADRRAFAELTAELRRYAESSESDARARILSAQTLMLGTDKDAVLDAIFRLRVPELTRKRTDAAYLVAEENRSSDGDPRTAWGLANGYTRLSQLSPYADERVALDRAAGRILEMAAR